MNSQFDIDNSEITKSVLAKALIDTSSDLIFVMGEIFKRTNEHKIDALKPVIDFEEGNWRTGFQNVKKAEYHLDNLSYPDLVDASDAYLFVMEVLLEEGSEYANKFPLTEDDEVGMSIYKELWEKRKYAQRLIAIYNSEKKS